VYETVDELYLTGGAYLEHLYLEKHIVQRLVFEKDGSTTMCPASSTIQVIPKGTRLRVCKVFVKTQFGSELCSQTILADLLDDQGNIIPKIKEFSSRVNVTFLFKNTGQMSNENWVFEPNVELIQKVDP
jgi:hypothetical protein